MFVKSKIKRSIGWCWKNGKSFKLTGIGIVNCAKPGADINLDASCCITEEYAEAFSHWTVYYYYHIKGTKCETKKEQQ